jgi:acyl carrier protein
MPTGKHEFLIASVEDSLLSQLEVIRNGSDKAALFAQKLWRARSTVINFPVADAQFNTNSKHEPDASFWHEDAQYPGVIIEVSYSQKRKMLGRLAEDYILDSDASVQVVVGLDIEYGKKGSREATLSVWRSHVFHTSDGDELRVVQEIADEVYTILRQYSSFLTSLPGISR